MLGRASWRPSSAGFAGASEPSAGAGLLPPAMAVISMTASQTAHRRSMRTPPELPDLVAASGHAGGVRALVPVEVGLLLPLRLGGDVRRLSRPAAATRRRPRHRRRSPRR